MAEDDFYEKLSIRDSVKSLKKYGSTSKHNMKRQESLIKHSIVSTDTLQGIALKYGVTTEQIRRINRLWASDSLFLREYLLIPVDTNSSYTNSSDNSQTLHSNNNTDTDTNKITSSISNSELDEPTIDSFLSNIDNSIANMKKEVKKAQGNSEFIKNTDLDTTYTKQKKHVVSRMRQSSSSSSTSSIANATTMKSSTLPRNPPPDIISNSSLSSYQNMMTSSQPHTVPMVITQTGRKLKTSTLQRLEQQQDEMFEL